MSSVGSRRPSVDSTHSPPECVLKISKLQADPRLDHEPVT